MHPQGRTAHFIMAEYPIHYPCGISCERAALSPSGPSDGYMRREHDIALSASIRFRRTTPPFARYPRARLSMDQRTDQAAYRHSIPAPLLDAAACGSGVDYSGGGTWSKRPATYADS